MWLFEQHVSDEGKAKTSTQVNVLDEHVVKSIGKFEVNTHLIFEQKLRAGSMYFIFLYILTFFTKLQPSDACGRTSAKKNFKVIFEF